MTAALMRASSGQYIRYNGRDVKALGATGRLAPQPLSQNEEPKPPEALARQRLVGEVEVAHEAGEEVLLVPALARHAVHAGRAQIVGGD